MEAQDAVQDVETARYRACAGKVQGFGVTPFDALQALMKRLPGDAPTPIVIWPFNQGDTFFTDAQQERLQELKARGETLSPSEQVWWSHLSRH